ncbi:DUF5994 family protein [Nocardia wallacei]|uniref:DUF5994 family protein n=1 Tax=Nocardia wallacei TaxID=480035 RepID=UPI002457E059|nr:DUF5994 family protein [Nocardia wallacei]
MTSQTARTGTGRYEVPANRPRLLIAPEERRSAATDGTWWPHGDDLVTELTELLPVLTTQFGPIQRVIYHLDEWVAAPGKSAIGDRRISLDGYRHRPTGTVEILPLDGGTLTLLVVPPGTAADSADAVMSADTGGAEQRWESEGGSGGYRSR